MNRALMVAAVLLSGCFGGGSGDGSGGDPSDPSDPSPTLPLGPMGPMGGGGMGGDDCEVGDSFPSGDGCNNCVCTEDGIACTTKACDPGQPVPSPTPSPNPSPGGGCVYGGQIYDPGDNFPSTDGCNTCECDKGGIISCTEKACAPPSGECPSALPVGGDPCPAEMECAYGDFKCSCGYGSPSGGSSGKAPPPPEPDPGGDSLVAAPWWTCEGNGTNG